MKTRPVNRVLAAMVLVAAMLSSLVGLPTARAAVPDAVPGFAAPTVHTQEAYHPINSDFTARWTRADAMQLQAMSDPTAGSRENSMPTEYTMPTVSQDFPDMSNDQVWVWDTWPLTDERSHQYSVLGWEVVFSLVADRSLGFDERHQFARIGYFYREAGIPADERPENGGWTYGGLLFEDGVTGVIFDDQSFSHQTEWSGSARVFPDGTVKLFFTDVAFYRDASGADIKPYDPRIALSIGTIHADDDGVSFTGFDAVTDLLQADGRWYQDGDQNPYFNFRDPFTFEDPAHPGETFMVFEGNSAVERGSRSCTVEDLGYAADDPHAEDLTEVMDNGAVYQMANVGLAVAENDDLTAWRFLPPILSANCVTDQTERPQIYIKDGKYYLFTISHRSTFAWGMDGPEGVYGFVGDGIRSDFQPLNRGSGLALGNPTNLNYLQGNPFDPDFNQHPGAFQAYSHYVMPNGLVQSFIDTIGTTDNFRRGGTLGPTVRLIISGTTAMVDRDYGDVGLGGYADIPADRNLVPTFSDVPEGLQFHDEIMWLAGERITTGYPDGTFRPTTPINRDAMAAFLYRFAGSPDFTPDGQTFVDVGEDNQFYTEIEWLAAQGITTGWETDAGREFRPTTAINRDAMAAFLYRFAGSPRHVPFGQRFVDVPPSMPFHTEIDWLATTGITTGWPTANGNEFRPTTPINRDAMAAFLYRYDNHYPEVSPLGAAVAER
ncbi:glycoside hydrolase family 68 protein [Propioniciclava soli]|uniref:glycoside hydrolase family 68 protein n=1 Tax=Propioniciclava soli TaxID=2775081 RepID=UPI001E2A7E2F